MSRAEATMAVGSPMSTFGRWTACSSRTRQRQVFQKNPPRKPVAGFRSQPNPHSNRVMTMASLSDKARRGAEMIVKSFNAIIIDE